MVNGEKYLVALDGHRQIAFACQYCLFTSSIHAARM